jgi:UPF0716 protein FxsA
MALLAPFLILPALEVAVFVLVCLAVGFWTAFGLVVAGSVAGIIVLRFQGLGAIMRMRQRLEAGDTAGVMEALWRTAAGALLVIPGFLTDVVALALMVPRLRRAIGAVLVGLVVASRVSRRSSRPGGDPRAEPRTPPERSAPPRPLPTGPVIDVEFEDLPPAGGARP